MTDRGQSYSSSSDPDVESPQAHKRDSSSSSRTKSSPTSTRDRERDRSTRRSSRRRSSSTDKKSASSSCSGLLSRTFQLLGRSFSRTVPLLAYIAGLAVVVLLLLGGILLWSYASPDSAEMNDPVLSRMVVSNFHSKKAESVGSASSSLLNLNAAAGDSKGGNTPLTLSGSIVASSPLSYDEDIEDAEDDDVDAIRETDGVLRPTWVFPPWTQQIQQQSALDVQQYATQAAQAALASATDGSMNVSPDDLTIFTFFTPAATASLLALQQHAIYSWTTLIPPRNIHIYTATADDCALVSTLHTDIQCRVSACVETRKIDMSEHDRQEAEEAALAAQKEKEKEREANSGGGSGGGADDWLSGGDSFGGGNGGGETALNYTIPPPRFVTVQAPKVQCFFHEALSSSTISSPFSAFVNDHILLFEDFMSGFNEGTARLGRSFAMVGQTKAVAMNVDDNLDRERWHRDLAQAVQYDTSAEKGVVDKVSTSKIPLGRAHILGGKESNNDDDEEEQSKRKKVSAHDSAHQHEHSDSSGSGHGDECHILNYFVFPTTRLAVERVPAGVLMGGFDTHEHRWESWVLAALLFEHELQVVDATTSVSAVEPTHHQRSNQTDAIHQHNLPLLQSDAWNTKALLGKIQNADFKFDGRCPRCVLVENHQADLSVMLQRQVLPLPDYILMDGVNAGFVGVSAAGSSSKDKNAKNAKGKKLKANAKDSKNTEVAPSAIRSDQNVIVLTVNADYLPLAYNWICRAHELGIHRYVFLAEDRVSYRTLLRMKVSVVIKKYAPFRKSAATFDTMEFQEMLYFRSLFFHQVLNAGYSVVYSHLDSVWFDNPLQYMRNQTCDVYHQAEKIRRVSGGLIAIRPTKIGLMFAKQYVMCEAKSWSFYVEHHRSRWSLSDDRAAECLDYVSQRLVKSQRGKYQKCLLDPLLFPDYHSFIEKEQSIRQGIWPSVVHFSTPHGVWNKTHEIKRWNLWRTSHGKEQESDEDDTLLDEEERKQRALAKVTSAETLEANRAKQLLAQGKQAENIFRDSSTLRSSLGSASISLSTPVAVPCLPVPAALPPPRRSSSHFTLSVTLLACDEANDVAILLSQIENAIYPLHDVIRLTILIDAPPADDEERMQAHHDTVEIAKKFSLSHGTKKVVVRRAHVGAETQWITSWMFQTGDDHELHLVLEPFVRLSPLYYQYIQQTAAAYYFANSGASSASSSSSSSSNEHSQATTGFDPRLMGFTLSHTNLIVGETLTERYGTRLPRSLLEEWSSSEFVAPSYAKNPSFTAIPKQTPRHLYLYQLPPTVAPVFFPRHWLAFTEWYMARRDARGAANSGRASSGNAGGNAAAAAAAAAAAGDEIAFTPCVPTFISNRWWQEDSDKFWWSWLIRFTFEQGFYFLHTNYGVQPNGAISATGAAGNSKPLALAIDARGGVARRSIVLHTSDDPSSLVSLTLFPVLKDLLLFDFHFAYIPYGKAHVLSRRITMLAPDAPLTAAQESLRGSSSLNAPGLVNEDEFEDDELFNPVAHTLAMMRSSLPSSSIGDNGDLSSFHSHYRSRRSRDLSVRARFASMNYDTMQPGAESRCYVIGDERLFTGPLQPLLSHDEDLAQVPIRVLYERTYLYNLQKMERSDPNDIPRFIVFSPKSDFTFDHGLRGLYFSFILSICLKRILLVDWPDFEKAYRPPLQNMQWSLHYPKFYTMYGKGTKSMTKAENTEQFRVGNLFSLYTGQFLINNERVSADRSVFQNQMYFSHLPPLYFGSTSRMRRTGMVLSFLLSNPSPFLLKKVETIRHHTGISRARHLVAVHVPVPTPWLGRLPRPGEAPKFGDPAAWGVLPGVVEKHWQCVKAMLTARNFDPNTTAILFTTNRAVAGVLAKAEEELSEFGRVVHWEERPPPRTYSGDPMAHAERQKQIDNYIDPNIVNGWLLGQAELSVSAGTTYGIFHAARTNFRKPANIVKVGLGVKILDGSYYPISDGNDYCGPMQRIDKPLDVDLEF